MGTDKTGGWKVYSYTDRGDEYDSENRWNRKITDDFRLVNLSNNLMSVPVYMGDVNVAAGTVRAYPDYKNTPGSVSVSVGGVNIRKGMSDAEVLELVRNGTQTGTNADMQYKIKKNADGGYFVEIEKMCKWGCARFCTFNQQNVQFQARPPTAPAITATLYIYFPEFL